MENEAIPMKKRLFALLSLLIFLIPHARAEATSGSDSGSREPHRTNALSEEDVLLVCVPVP